MVKQLIFKYKLYRLPFILITGLMLFNRLLLIKSFSLDLGGLEYYFLNITQRVMHHEPLYTNPQLFPYSNCLYTPIYFYIYGFILHIDKYNFHDHIHEMLVAGRRLSFFLVLLVFVILKKLTAKFSSSGFYYLIILTLFVLLISGHIYAVRPDALKLLFFMLFLYCLIEYLFYSQKTGHGIMAVLFAVLAVYSKQDIAVHIGICFLAALYYKRNKKTLLLFSAFILLCSLIFALYYRVYGNTIITNLFLFNAQSVTNLLGSYNIYFILLSIIRTAPLLVLVFLNYKCILPEHSNKPAEKFIITTTLALYIIVHLSLLRPGANFNYTYELIVCLLLNLSIYFSVSHENIIKRKTRYLFILSAYLVLLLLTNIMLQTYSYDPAKQASFRKEYDRCIEDRNKIDQIVKNDTLFFPNTKYAIYYTGKNVVLGHDMHLDRFINLYTSVHIQSKLTLLNTNEYDSNFTLGKVKYILIEKNRKSILHVEQYYPDYYLFEHTSNFLVYKFGKRETSINKSAIK